MVFFQKSLIRINSPYYCQVLKQNLIALHAKYSSTTSSETDNINLKPKFSDAEQEKILTILNQSNRDHLLSLNVSQTRIKTIENYRKRKGPFRSLDELLEVDGLGVKVLEKLCRQIVSEPINDNVKKTNGGRKLKQFLIPPLPQESPITSVVGIHLAPIGVSWAKLVQSNNQLDCWGHLDFINLPKKMLPHDTFKLALNILNKLPIASVYVLEGSSNMGLQGQKQPSTVTSYTQQMELSSMLLALINTSHNADSNDLENKVYFLRPKLPARLFKTLVGNECVSSTATVLQLLDSSTSNNFTLPCSPITLNQTIKNEYLSVSSACKELLGQALMLSVAFTDICVKKNQKSIDAVTPGRRSSGV